MQPRRRRTRWDHPGSGPARASEPNEVWTTDFKGHGDYIALEDVDDGLWNILLYTTLLGRFDEATGKITGADFWTERGRNS